MSTQPIAAYSFLPWARQGLGIFIREGDQDHAVTVRGSIDVSLQITADTLDGGTATETIPQAVQLYGPGDIIGVDPRMIVRSEPRHWITNFENNYLPFIEFYEEDFPWRYTPAKASPDGKRLRPWLALAVLEEDEFKDGTNVLGRPLSYIDVVDAAASFPPFDQLWAWAHVHVNGGLGSYSDPRTTLASNLDAALQADRDVAYSRVLCPRILKANTGYHAFLVPSFETGRLAGLGADPNQAQYATQSAWEGYTGKAEPTCFPYYHRWYFRTGSVGDFEYLVRLLQPRTVDPRVGRRDIDVQDPAPVLNLPGIPELGGILRLGGALRAPLDTLSEEDLAEYNQFERWGEPYPHAFQTALAALANLASGYKQASAMDANTSSGLPVLDGDEDPWIVPPIYGRWHALTQELAPAGGDPDQRRWVHELNLDPRHRTAAGFGTQVVQKNQENYMEAAWQQVGRVLEGNQKIRFVQMARLTSLVWYRRELAAVRQSNPEKFLAIAAPVQRRIVADGLTIQRQIQTSTLPPALTSKTLRQALRPRARLARLAGFDASHGLSNLLERANRGEVSAAPPKVIAPALPSDESLAGELRPEGLPADWLDALAQNPWLRFLPLLLALLLAVILLLINPLVGVLVGVVLLAGAFWLYRRLDEMLDRLRAVEVFSPEGQTPAAVDRLPQSPDFRTGLPGRDPLPTTGDRDSPEAARFKESLRNLYTVDAVERAIERPARRPLALPSVAQASFTALDPSLTTRARLLGSLSIPGRISDRLADPYGEVMVYPEIDLPMYEPLKDMSGELFLPNLQLIENNSITLLETNQKFIEAYMVGLNHEFARELLWREYPTDQRGSYFRQFWDVSSFLAEAGADLEALRERLFDIPELHTWDTETGLGEHDHREAQGDKEDELVLVIRGELLKKYPTAVVYAHRAEWELTGDGEIDKGQPRKLAPLTPAQEADPPRDLVKTPLYEARVDPDIYFFGFDLTADQARGGQVVDGREDPGWFFVIKERPGEPRFGLDLPKDAPQASIHTWNELSWTDVLADYGASSFLRLGERQVSLTAPPSGDPAEEQYQEDSRFRWRGDTHAAELAYILYQVPVMMAVHASEMLKQAG